MNRLAIIGALGAGALSSSMAGASTWSCASVPLLGAMQPASPMESQWFLGTIYEYHDLSDRVAGSTSIPDQTGRDRTLQALIVEASRGITTKLSVSALLLS